MAREARRAMADARAMEEEMSRLMLHGAGVSSAYGGRMTGAGATPSMGLSQHRGGRRRRSPSPDEYDDEDLEGGNLFALLRAAASRTAAAAKAATARAKAAAENARRAAQGKTTQVKPSSGTAPRPPPKTAPAPAKPSTSAPAPRPADKVIGGPSVKAPVGSTRTKLGQIASKAGTATSRLGTVANVAIPAYMLYDYLNQQGGEDLGYFDDYAGEGTPDQVDEGAVLDDGGETGLPDEFDTQADTGMTDTGRPMDDKDAIAASMGLTRKQYDILVRSGNLPVRRGRGKLTIQHEGGAMRTHGITREDRERAMRMREASRPQMPTVAERLPPRAKPLSRAEAQRFQRQAVAQQALTQSARRSAPVPVLTASGRKSKATGRRQERAEVVKRVMRERGVKLGEASRIVKEEGLF